MITFVNYQEKEVTISPRTVTCQSNFDKSARDGLNDICIIYYEHLSLYGETISTSVTDASRDKYVMGIDWSYGHRDHEKHFSNNIVEVGGELRYISPICVNPLSNVETSICILIPGGKSKSTTGDSGKFGFYPITNVLVI